MPTDSATRALVGRVAELGRLEESMLRNLGPVILGALQDDDVTEVYCNPQDREVRVDRRSRGRTSFPCTLGVPETTRFLNAVAARVGVILGPDSPFVQAELPDGVFRRARVQGFVPPVTRGPTFVIRKPATRVFSLDDYVMAGALYPLHRRAIGDAVREHQSIVIAGGTNSGKTTLANAILAEITTLDPTERIVLLEDTAELQCAARDHLALRTPAGGTLAELVKATLRASPNRIIVGEVRDAAALDLLDAWATGHPGGVATVHASTAAGALRRLDRLAQRANVPPQAELVAEAVDWVVVVRQRMVVEVVHVLGLDRSGSYWLEAANASTEESA
jgi:P-type conjugative transfer ATPase TrbB